MRATITVTLSDTVTLNGLPARQFVATAPVSLELTTEPDEFMASVETLVAQNLTSTVARLMARIQSNIAAYTKQVEATGLAQPDLPGIQQPPQEG